MTESIDSTLSQYKTSIQQVNEDTFRIRNEVMSDIESGKILPHHISSIPLKYIDVTRLPGVPTDNIMTPSKGYKPFRYEFGYTMHHRQNQDQWMPEEVPMFDDIRDWKTKLNDTERNLMTNIFPLFVQNDVLVNNAYIHHYGRIFLPHEIQMGISAIANIESTHTAAYAHLLDSLSFPENIYTAFMEYKEMSDKYDFTAGYSMDTLLGIAVAMVVFGGLTEGLQLFATFSILMNFPRHNKLKGMGQIVSWSVRDELSHVIFVSELFNHFMAEFGHLIPREQLVEGVERACRIIVENEIAFSKMAFSMGDIEGLTLNDHIKFIRYISNTRMKQFGFNALYDEPENPYEWFDKMVGGLEHANFFEARSTSYSRNATQGDWESAWNRLTSTG